MQRVLTPRCSVLVSLLAVGVVACTPGGRADDPGHDGSPPPPPPIDAGGPTEPDAAVGPFDDFPAAPIIDGTAPANAGDLFGVANVPNVAGPCLAEPQIGSLLPKGFLRPRFTLAGTAGQNLFEIRIHSEHETNDLVVYTSNTQWKMPAEHWANISLHLGDRPLTVTIRGATYNGTQLTAGPTLGTSGDITVAPVGATGSIVYWTTSGGTALKAFKIGEETVDVVLRPKNAEIAAPGCLGCHSLTPDGQYLSFSWVVGTDGFAGRIDLRAPLSGDSNAIASRPPFLTDTAIGLLSRTAQHAPVYSKAHWSDHDHIAITMLQGVGGTPTDIIWTDLETTSNVRGVGWDVISRVGDANSAAAAAFSHDGLKLAYVSGTGIDSGVRDHAGDIWTVPYNNRLGGTATPVNGASDPSMNESYPSFSADDALIAFNRTDNFGSSPPSYDNPSAEIFVVNAEGGPAVRLKANDPNTCGSAGAVSPGVTNSWPKWSPGPVDNVAGKRYYWLTFSSRRGTSRLPQIYVAPVVVTESGIETYPAIYLWNQPASEANHTPAWDNLQIP